MKNISKSKRNLGKQVIAAVMALSLAAPLYARYNPKPRWSLFSVQQEVDAGKQYSAEIEKELPLVNDAEVNRYVGK
jgi:predicted Zn-dependent protease